jgi:hypothetical protein
MMSTADDALAATSPPILAEASPPDRRAWVALACLWFIYVLNFLDRQLLSILAKPIQDTLHITDGQLGLLGGLYFAAFYCFIAIPVGWLADRTNRVAVLAIACGVWSVATMACGVAKSYGSFAVARMTVGFGRRPALLCDHHRLLPAGATGQGAGPLQSWPAGRRGPGHRVRRLRGGGVQLAGRLPGHRRGRRRRGPGPDLHRA